MTPDFELRLDRLRPIMSPDFELELDRLLELDHHLMHNVLDPLKLAAIEADIDAHLKEVAGFAEAVGATSQTQQGLLPVSPSLRATPLC